MLLVYEKYNCDSVIRTKGEEARIGKEKVERTDTANQAKREEI